MKLHFLLIKPERCPSCGSKDERYARDLAVGGPTCDHAWHGFALRGPQREEEVRGPRPQFTDTSFEATQARLAELRQS